MIVSAVQSALFSVIMKSAFLVGCPWLTESECIPSRVSLTESECIPSRVSLTDWEWVHS